MGSVYVLHERGFTARYDLRVEGAIAPFLLCAAHGEEGRFRLLLARACSAEGKAAHQTFELLEVSLDAGAANGLDDAPGVLEPNWRLKGLDLPYWAVWAEGGWLVLSEEPFEKNLGASSEAERGARPRPEAEARRGVGVVDDPEIEEEVEMADPTPFTWTQDGGSVSITVNLPTGTPKAAVTVGIRPGSLLVSVGGDVPSHLAGWLAHEHSFWSDIIADKSTWTYDAVSGALELILAKRGGDMRWPSVFVPSDDSDDDVPESFTAADIDSLRATFSRAQVTATDDEPVLASSMPALLREEMDIDSDDDDEGQRGVGRICVVGHIVDGRAAWSRQTATVLSLPLAGDLHSGIVIKQALDGLAFTPNSDPTREPWTHISTNPALAFVLRSKRDLRLVRHIHDTVLAFDSGSGLGTGNAYVYYPPEDAETARQGVVGVSGGGRGALLGATAVSAAGRAVVVALCERALVVPPTDF